MDFEKKIITKRFKELSHEGFTLIKEFHLQDESDLFVKDHEKSAEARQQGNRLFTKEKHNENVHEDVWKFYCKSIAFAPNKSEELATGYANRSVILLHMKKYNDSLVDIERALNMTGSSALKVKLFCRQIECYVALQNEKAKSSLENAKSCLSKVDDPKEVEKLQSMIDRAEKLVEDKIFLAEPNKEKKSSISCDNDKVRISHEAEYGRCLIATQDIDPGEFVCVEKFYATSVNILKLYAYCSHCLAISWTLIPCDQCAYYMYCSDKCKDEAWNKYHDIECKARLMKGTGLADYLSQLCLKIFIMGFKEVGSNLENMKAMVKQIDNYKKPLTKGFSSDGQFSSNSFRSLWSLSFKKTEVKLTRSSELAIGIFVPLVKNTNIFDKRFQLKKLVKNEDAIFVGSVILRLIFITFTNSFDVLHMSRGCKGENKVSECITKGCCLRGTQISLLASLINHSCNNNVGKLYTNDGRVVYYALKPIKKNSQIFSFYMMHFMQEPKIVRQAALSLICDFNCICLACKQDWPTFSEIRQVKDKYQDTHISKALLVTNSELVKCLTEETRTQRSIETIHAFCKDIEVLYTVVEEPTFVTCMCIRMLSYLMDNYYCEVLDVPKTC